MIKKLQPPDKGTRKSVSDIITERRGDPLEGEPVGRPYGIYTYERTRTWTG